LRGVHNRAAITPRVLVDQLNCQVHAILQSEDVKKHLYEIGMEMAPTTPEQFQQTIAQEIALHAELVKAAGLVPQ
jgi:tripartite-type tricarboxylate transporter receptor subunit TctC